MTPNDAALALLALLRLPDGAANVLVWYGSDLPTLRVWVAERYLWDVKNRVPAVFENYAVEVELRPDISAHRNAELPSSIIEMTRTAPQTIYNDVIDKLNAFQRSLKHYATATDFSVKHLEAEIKKLMSVDAFSAHSALGALYQMTGDCEKMRHHFKNAGKLGNHIEAIEHQAVGEINLGYFSRAQSLFKEVAEPTSGRFTSAYRLGATCGAFQLLSNYLEHAKQLRIDVSGLNTDDDRRAARILSNAGVSDDETAAMLDLAGEVMRAHKVIFTETQVFSSNQDQCVYMTINLPCNAEETATMFDQLADKIATRIDPIPSAFYVSFRPAAEA